MGIDGRTDRFGAEYIERYLDALELKGSWRSVIATSAPTSALLHQDSPLVHVLSSEFDWRIIGKEGEWVLLTPSAKVPQGIR